MPGDATWRAWFRRHLSPRARFELRRVRRGLEMPRWGNLRRLRPFSEKFGAERGTPIDRYYLHRFLDQHRHLITGRVLEVQSSGYTEQYGHALTARHSVDIVTRFNASPTYLVDLARADGVIPDGDYDCFLLPNTLSGLRDIEPCLRNALRVVRPGGVVLATTAAFAPLMPDSPDYWRVSADGWKVLTERVWAGCDVRIEPHGNCLTAVAAMLGLALEELDPAELEYNDPRYPVLVTVECRKPAGAPA